MTTQAVTTAPAESKKLLSRVAEKFGIEPTKMMDTLKATAFRVPEGTEVSNEQMMALLIVAEQYDLNPWTKEIYAFPDKQKGIVPVVGVDGWTRIINSNPMMNGIEYVYSDQIVESPEHKPCPAWIECIIHRKDRDHPIRVREYLVECYRPPFKGNGKNGPYVVAGPWQSHTSRFLRHKVTIQCARLAFGFAGIYDVDEAERIIEASATIIESAPKVAKKSAKAHLDDFAGVAPALTHGPPSDAAPVNLAPDVAKEAEDLDGHTRDNAVA